MLIANARFAITAWDEKPRSEGADLPQMTRASVTKTLTGVFEDGEANERYTVVPGSGTGELQAAATARRRSATAWSTLSR